MTTYNNTELLKTDLLNELFNQGGEHTYTYTCKYGKKRVVMFYVVKNEYGRNRIIFKRSKRKYEIEHFSYNQLSSKQLVGYETIKNI
jgi:hypothetical protein